MNISKISRNIDWNQFEHIASKIWLQVETQMNLSMEGFSENSFKNFATNDASNKVHCCRIKMDSLNSEE